MLVGRTLITLVPLISAGCVGFRRFVGRICVPLCQAIPRFTNNALVFLLNEVQSFLKNPSENSL